MKMGICIALFVIGGLCLNAAWGRHPTSPWKIYMSIGISLYVVLGVLASMWL